MTTYCFIATLSSLFLFKHVKHGNENIQTDGFLTTLKCTKFVFGRGFAPNLAMGAYSAPPDLLSDLRGLLLRIGEGKGKGEEGETKGREGKLLDPPLTTNA